MTRRQLLAAAIGTVGLALADAPADAVTPAPDEGELLNGALAVELLAAFAYQHVLDEISLTPRADTTLRRLLHHEQAHAAALTRALSSLEGAAPPPPPPPPPASPADADAQLAKHRISPPLEKLRTESDALDLLLDLEKIVEGVYYDALSKLTHPNDVRLAAEILAAEAQHATWLSDLRHPDDLGRSVPDAFVEGRKP